MSRLQILKARIKWLWNLQNVWAEKFRETDRQINLCTSLIDAVDFKADKALGQLDRDERYVISNIETKLLEVLDSIQVKVDASKSQSYDAKKLAQQIAQEVKLELDRHIQLSKMDKDDTKEKIRQLSARIDSGLETQKQMQTLLNELLSKPREGPHPHEFL